MLAPTATLMKQYIYDVVTLYCLGYVVVHNTGQWDKIYSQAKQYIQNNGNPDFCLTLNHGCRILILLLHKLLLNVLSQTQCLWFHDATSRL